MQTAIKMKCSGSWASMNHPRDRQVWGLIPKYTQPGMRSHSTPCSPCHYWHCPHTGVLLTASKITNSSLLLWDSFPRQLWTKTVSQAPNLEETVIGLRQQKGKINTLSSHFCQKWLWPFKELQMNQSENTRALQTARDCNHSCSSKAGEVLRIPRPRRKGTQKILLGY